MAPFYASNTRVSSFQLIPNNQRGQVVRRILNIGPPTDSEYVELFADLFARGINGPRRTTCHDPTRLPRPMPTMVSDRRSSQMPNPAPSFCPSPHDTKPALAGFPPKIGQIRAKTRRNPANGPTQTNGLTDRPHKPQSQTTPGAPGTRHPGMEKSLRLLDGESAADLTAAAADMLVYARRGINFTVKHDS